uniref:Uncharacterized protein n=1 Tax=Anguilla anguilla TaxID=7936 RepID=A0A0E9VQ69_ANGAN
MTRAPHDLSVFHSLLVSFSSMIASAKSAFFHSQIQTAVSNPHNQLISLVKNFGK